MPSDVVAPSQQNNGNEDGSEAQVSTSVNGGFSAYRFFLCVVIGLFCNQFLPVVAQLAFLKKKFSQKVEL